MTDIDTLDLEASAELLHALAHGVRLALLRALTDAEHSVGEIEQITGIVQPGLSQQLGVLRKADLVTTRREAKLVFYSINRDRIAQVSALLNAFAGTVALPANEAAARMRASSSGAAMFARVARRP